MNRKKLKELVADAEKWESRELGASPDFAGHLPDALQQEMDEALDEGLGLVHISIRLNKSVVDDLKILATQDGIGYQPLIRQVLARYVAQNEERLKKTAKRSKSSVARVGVEAATKARGRTK